MTGKTRKSDRGGCIQRAGALEPGRPLPELQAQHGKGTGLSLQGHLLSPGYRYRVVNIDRYRVVNMNRVVSIDLDCVSSLIKLNALVHSNLAVLCQNSKRDMHKVQGYLAHKKQPGTGVTR